MADIDVDDEHAYHIAIVARVGAFALVLSLVFALMRNNQMALTMLFLFLGIVFFLLHHLYKEGRLGHLRRLPNNPSATQTT